MQKRTAVNSPIHKFYLIKRWIKDKNIEHWDVHHRKPGSIHEFTGLIVLHCSVWSEVKLVHYWLMDQWSRD